MRTRSWSTASTPCCRARECESQPSWSAPVSTSTGVAIAGWPARKSSSSKRTNCRSDAAASS